MTIDETFARTFAAEWIAAWNSHDLSQILSHYEDNVELTSPMALKLLGDGTVRGKGALGEYFSIGLKAYSDLKFDLIEVLWGLETLVLVYKNNVRGNKTAEVMRITTAGKIDRIWANYDQ
ncbi:MAG: nuclear transport factor 2 family protein [Acidobacteriota bacterium]|nr:nuclear transport factor 2 family protein [Acidobacteriota bacterium]